MKAEESIMSLWVGGPADGAICEIPHLSESWTIAVGTGEGDAPNTKHNHKYVLTDRKTEDGMPIYEHRGVVA